MPKLQQLITLASSSTVALIIVLCGFFLLFWFSYWCYRAGRDFEVYLLERQRLRDEMILREEEENK